MNRPMVRPPLAVAALNDATAAVLAGLADSLDGELRADPVTRALYATDASIYELMPLGVAMPRTPDDVRKIVVACAEAGIPITPRTAGTSLAGQAVGPGLVIDLGRYMTAIGDLDAQQRVVTVEPGVIRDELNRWLKPHGLLFGPDTSTSDRCMVGGMVGNNSCGSHSILYGTTRDNLASLDVVLADGAIHTLGPMTRASWEAAERGSDVFARALQTLRRVVGEHAEAIRAAYPREDCVRRNTGYPLDDLANSWLGHNPDRDPDLARFFCGTEGTLGVMLRARLKLWPVPRKNIVVVAHFDTVDASLRATVAAVAHKPAAVELIDKRILDLAALNLEQARNRWFVQGDPGALLVIEFYGDSDDELTARCERLIAEFEQSGLGYAYPVVRNPRIGDVWALRSAGLGILSGKPGDIKPVTLVEDTAVPVDKLPEYIRDFARVMADHATDCVYYAHASVGELHMRPELDLKNPDDIQKASSIMIAITDLVKKYQGALSGEHGDGRLRSPYLERVFGPEVYGLHRDVKDAFDPRRIFNPGNIVDPAPMEQDWRYGHDYANREVDTEFGWTDAGGFQRAVEACNGTGVCRRHHTAGGTMCPSFMATHEERETTRGRANLFRRMIQQGPDALWSSTELHDALDLCLSCKGCKSDCPASVDMARMKAEFGQKWMDRNGTPLAYWMFANVTELGAIPQAVPGGSWVANAVQRARPTRGLLNRLLKLAPKRSMPAFSARSAHAQLGRAEHPAKTATEFGRVVLYVDEFTDRFDAEVAVAAVELLTEGGWRVLTPRLGPSGRALLSKGFVRRARSAIEHNLVAIERILDGGPVEAIVGIEPSAVLTLADEARDLPRDPAMRARAARIAPMVGLVEDFIATQAAAGRFAARFTEAARRVVLHGHCHQKALVGTKGMAAALSLPTNYSVDTLPTGCCGMAGSFGYEAEHYDVSMQVGELVLFPAVRRAASDTLVAAPGTSCRHQIHDGTGRSAVHPIVVLRDALASREAMVRRD